MTVLALLVNMLLAQAAALTPPASPDLALSEIEIMRLENLTLKRMLIAREIQRLQKEDAEIGNESAGAVSVIYSSRKLEQSDYQINLQLRRLEKIEKPLALKQGDK